MSTRCTYPLYVFLAVSSLAAFAADAKYDGAKVHYESHGKGKEAVVFIHGWTCGVDLSEHPVL